MNDVKNYREMVSNLIKPGEDILKSLDARKCHVQHMSWALCGEIAELAPEIIANNTKGIREEMGDIEFYYEGICLAFDFAPDTDHDALHQSDWVPFANLDMVCGGDHLVKILKKWIIVNKPLDTQKLEACLQSINNTLEDCYATLGLDRAEVRRENMDKLLGTETTSGRHGTGSYSDDAQEARADKQSKGFENETCGL